MSNTISRLPDPPREENMTPENLRKYFDSLNRAIYDNQKKNVTGPINSTPMVPTNYTNTTALNAGTANTTDVANVLCTLIQLLKDGGLLK